MKSLFSVLLQGTSLLLLSGAIPALHANGMPAQTAPALSALQNLPLGFEAAPGSTPAEFRARGCNYQFRILPTQSDIVIWKRLADDGVEPAMQRGDQQITEQLAGRSVRMELLGAAPHAPMSGETPLPGKLNYLLGSDSGNWRSGQGTFASVRVRSVYPGIDLVYYGNQQSLEYDFVVAPNADPSKIQFALRGADKISIGAEGELLIKLGQEVITQHRPIVYQTIGGKRVTIPGAYRLEAGTVGFELGSYDKSLPLVIDPVLTYSTYFGGNLGDLALAVKLDGNGNIYVAGETLSSSFPIPLPGGFQTSFGGGKINGDAFVAKFNPIASQLVYFTYLGGRGNDGALDLAVDGSGRAFITGFTDSDNFPFLNAIQPRIFGTPTASGFYSDAFVAELDASGSALVFSTYLGGNGLDSADAIALDPTGNIYVGGRTYSTNFPAITANNSLPGQSRFGGGSYDGFVAKLGSGGSPLLYASYLGGTNVDEVQGIAADADGFAYATGYTASTNFPTANAFRRNLNGYSKLPTLNDAFVARIAPDGKSFAFSTFLGGTNSDSGYRIALDAQKNIFVTGATRSLDFPNTLTNIPDLHTGITNNKAAYFDAFVTKLSVEGNLLSSVQFGADAEDVGWDLALDAAGDVFVVGTTASTNFPSLNATNWPSVTKARKMTDFVFITAFDNNLAGALYSLKFGGSGNDRGYGIAVDPAGNAYVVGKTFSTNFPVAGPLQSSLVGVNDTFLTKVSLEPSLNTAAAGTGQLELKWRAFSPDYSVESSQDAATTKPWHPLDLPITTENGWHKVLVGTGTNQDSIFRLRRAGQ